MGKRKKIVENINEVKEAMEKTKSATEYRKLQCVYLGDTKPEMSASQIGEITQYSERNTAKAV